MPGAKSEAPTNVMLLVGQLIEATRAASEGLQSIHGEVRSQAQTIITMATTLEGIERRVGQIEQSVLDGTHDKSLVNLVREQQQALRTLSASLTSLSESAKTTRDKLDSVADTTVAEQSHSRGVWKTMMIVGAVVAWVATTAISMLALFKDK